MFSENEKSLRSFWKENTVTLSKYTQVPSAPRLVAWSAAQGQRLTACPSGLLQTGQSTWVPPGWVPCWQEWARARTEETCSRLVVEPDRICLRSVTENVTHSEKKAPQLVRAAREQELTARPHTCRGLLPRHRGGRQETLPVQTQRFP